MKRTLKTVLSFVLVLSFALSAASYFGAKKSEAVSKLYITGFRENAKKGVKLKAKAKKLTLSGTYSKNAISTQNKVYKKRKTVTYPVASDCKVDILFEGKKAGSFHRYFDYKTFLKMKKYPAFNDEASAPAGKKAFKKFSFVSITVNSGKVTRVRFGY